MSQLVISLEDLFPQDALWVDCYTLKINGELTKVDYCNSGFTLHEGKLYIRDLGGLEQFSSNVYSKNPRVLPLVEDKDLPPEVLYLLWREELAHHLKQHDEMLFKPHQKGGVWDLVADDNDDCRRVILDDEKFTQNQRQFLQKLSLISINLNQLWGECSHWFVAHYNKPMETIMDGLATLVV